MVGIFYSGLGLHILKVNKHDIFGQFSFCFSKAYVKPVSPAFSYRQSKVSILLPVDTVPNTIYIMSNKFNYSPL